MKIKKQAIFPILMMLVVTALALIGSSFAWFSIANIATVSQITTSAQSADVEFLISNDGSHFYTKNLDMSTYQSDTDNYINPGTLYQTSTAGEFNATNGLLKFFNADYSGYTIGSGNLSDTEITSGADNSLAISNTGALSSAYVDTAVTYGRVL